MRDRLFRDGNLTLDAAVKICHVTKLWWMVDVEYKKDTTAHMVSRNMMSYDCRWCVNRHIDRQCPAYGKNCAKCDRRNTFVKMCFLDKTEDKKQLKLNPRHCL